MRVWIDTDVGDNPDDAVALALAAAHPEVDLVGVSTVGGDHDRRVLAARSLTGVAVHRGDAPGLADVVRAAEPDAILGLGPLTNVAAWLGAWSERGIRPPPVTVMGGTLAPVRHRGAEQTVEHNFGADPSAAAAVVDADVPLVLVPLDVTAAMRLGTADHERLVCAVPTLAEPVERHCAMLRALGLRGADAQLCLHDPLALLGLVEPAIVTFEEVRITVDPDGRVVTGPGRLCRVAVRVDGRAAIDRVLTLLESRGPAPRDAAPAVG